MNLENKIGLELIKVVWVLVPWILIICPSFSAAPRILESFRTRRSIFEALNMRDEEGDSVEEDDVARRKDSLIAPKPIPAANPP